MIQLWNKYSEVCLKGVIYVSDGISAREPPVAYYSWQIERDTKEYFCIGLHSLQAGSDQMFKVNEY